MKLLPVVGLSLALVLSVAAVDPGPDCVKDLGPDCVLFVNQPKQPYLWFDDRLTDETRIDIFASVPAKIKSGISLSLARFSEIHWPILPLPFYVQFRQDHKLAFNSYDPMASNPGWQPEIDADYQDNNPNPPSDPETLVDLKVTLLKNQTALVVWVNDSADPVYTYSLPRSLPEATYVNSFVIHSRTLELQNVTYYFTVAPTEERTTLQAKQEKSNLLYRLMSK